MKRLIFTLLTAGLFLCTAKAQEHTNAFDDLARKGDFTDNFNKMRVVVSPLQLSELLNNTPSCGYLSFTEDRSNDISRTDSIPLVWYERAENERTKFIGSALPGEYYSFQIGIYPHTNKIELTDIVFSTLESNKNLKINSSALTCFNIEGVESNGDSFKKSLTLETAKVQALWIGVAIPDDAKGKYKGKATLNFKDAPSQDIDIELTVAGDKVANSGYNEGWRKSRLNWLNSNIGRESRVTAPYIPITSTNSNVTYLGGEVVWNDMALPKEITSFYNANNALSDERTAILASEGMNFIIETTDGIETLNYATPKLVSSNETKAVYSSTSKNQNFVVKSTTTFSFDGFAKFDITVEALKKIEVKDIRLEIAYSKYASKYIMGLDRRGGLRSEKKIDWRWNVAKNQDKIWLGNINAGLNLQFSDDEYVRPLVNVYYDLGRLSLPKSWGNNCRGGITIDEKEDEVVMKVYSGARKMFATEQQHYNFQMLITPVRPQNFALQSEERFYHSNSDVSSNYLDEAVKHGANNINIHHKKDIYPFINYPYYDESVGDLKEFINKAHEKDVKVRAYYTTRELTVKTPEFWALRSLGGEVLHDGPGRDTRTLIHSNGPHKWLNDNLGTNFIPAWYNAFNEGKYKGDMDLSVITTPDSRWNNYYLEGLDWMIKEIGLDGVYIDDSALDRITLQRARRILDSDGKRRLIDIHSWSHFNQYAGYANSLHLYLELLPYVDRLWIGEGFPASSPADLWLIEMSGIPFGLMSETLDAQNIFRGMIYGMLPRLPWSGNPVPMWKFWDEFGMKDALISGYWSDDCPVSQNNENIKTTIYKLENKALIVIANWSQTDQNTSLNIDEKMLGFKIKSLSLPKIEGDIQELEVLNSLQNLTIPAERGMFIILEK